MELATLHAELVNKKVRSYYIFTGDEIAVQNIYIAQIAKIKRLKVFRAESIVSVLTQLKNSSLLSKTACYVVRDDYDFIKHDTDTVFQMLGDNILILLYTKADGRSAFFKKYKDSICEFSALPIATLKKYIQKEVPLSDKSAEYLAELCESNYSRILLECDKIKRYANVVGCNADEAFRRLVIDNTIYSPPEDAVFSWVDAVLRNKHEKAWELYSECKRYGCPVLSMISLLYNNTKQTLQVQSYEGNSIEKATGLTSAQIRFAKQRSNIFLNSELITLMKLLHEAEMGIKLGKIDESIALDVAMIKFIVGG